MSQRASIVIVDDHALFRSGVRAEVEGDLDVLADVGSVEEAVRVISSPSAPTLSCSTCTCPAAAASRWMRRVAESNPAQRFSRSVSDAAEDVTAVVRAGARGYVTKSISGEELPMPCGVSATAMPSSHPASQLRARRLRGLGAGG